MGLYQTKKLQNRKRSNELIEDIICRKKKYLQTICLTEIKNPEHIRNLSN